jgi:peptidoglycan/xylan/chitin deacetylase (PgdA/CDA1 family)
MDFNMFANRRVKVPILAYHALVPDQHGDTPASWSKRHTVKFEAFCRQLDFMQADGWISTLPAAMKTSALVKNLKYYIVTFDDGHKSDVIAAAMMKERGIYGAFYVPWSHIDKPDFLSRSDIQTLIKDGFVIGSHCMTHSPLTEKSTQELHCELFDSRARFEDLLGQAVEDLALPFGRYNNRVIAVAKAAGYRRIMSSNTGVARVGNFATFPRLPVTANTTLSEFHALITASPSSLLRRRVTRAFKRRLNLSEA